MHIINGLLVTLSYLHDFNILHNDIHSQNILLHFGREVYVGLADWGRATKLPTTDHFPSMIDNDDKATKNEFKRKYKHVAPERICTSPPPYSKAQDVYSVSYQVQRLVYCIPCGSRKDTFVDHVLQWAKAGLSSQPSNCPFAFDLSIASHGANAYGFDIVRASRLQPINE